MENPLLMKSSPMALMFIWNRLEQMNHDQWWIGIQSGGKDFHLWFTEDGRLCVCLSDQDDENARWEGDNREKPLPGADA
jgi:hypothetical protein